MSTTDTTTSTTHGTTSSMTTAARLAALTARLDSYEAARRELFAIPRGTDRENAVRAARLALVSARITGVWRLVSAHAVDDLTVPDLFHRAAVLAECDARDSARFWRDTAADWQARADGRPTSDAAGALSNWQDLGVTA